LYCEYIASHETISSPIVILFDFNNKSMGIMDPKLTFTPDQWPRGHQKIRLEPIISAEPHSGVTVLPTVCWKHQIWPKFGRTIYYLKAICLISSTCERVLRIQMCQFVRRIHSNQTSPLWHSDILYLRHFLTGCRN